ncbi:MAG: S-methyl-5'-thioadenosine phosphorylase [Asgard group archaeon]|nr:S-methyl-5'-thioadenosine phosphorylase [Asgard group archaeon]
MTDKIGVIGGSGFYSLKKKATDKIVDTPFGNVKLELLDIAGKEVVFLTRHGINHHIPPHLINYRANIFALFSLGVTKIISSSAVGSLQRNIPPGSFVLPNQFIDFTKNRSSSFFDGEFSVILLNGEKRQGVVHLDFTKPYSSSLQKEIVKSAKKLSLPIFEKGVYVCTEGPRFETPAEISAFKKLGGTLVGMTSVTECVLANELDIAYTPICLVTNYAAGLQEKISMDEVHNIFNEKIKQIQDLILTTIEEI